MLEDKNETYYDQIIKAKYYPWMRKVFVYSGVRLIILSMALGSYTTFKSYSVIATILSIGALVLGIVMLVVGKKASDQSIAHLFSSYEEQI